MIDAERDRILVVDDEIKMCATLKRFLEGNHYAVEVAHDGEDALEKLERFLPRCVIMDIRMPVRNGIETLKVIKSTRPGTEVIMTTAITNESQAQECLGLGACDFIFKPIRLAELLEKVRKALRSRRESDGKPAPERT
ncbi:MAG: response regulator [Nitrospinae bacterium]|nr:response regulator [Nitrospinota bacterium]